ncbi:MAG: hypothetical protein LBL45_08120 [Treponema sp.]|jgi:ATP-binding cassette subfamily B protein|nr:hypothetical protein [Treponema sp.]
MKCRQQLDETDCGPACLAMIASHYKVYKSVTTIRRICGAGATGANLMGLMMAAQQLGFRVKLLRREVKDDALNAKLSFPFGAYS